MYATFSTKVVLNDLKACVTFARHSNKSYMQTGFRVVHSLIKGAWNSSSRGPQERNIHKVEYVRKPVYYKHTSLRPFYYCLFSRNLQPKRFFLTLYKRHIPFSQTEVQALWISSHHQTFSLLIRGWLLNFLIPISLTYYCAKGFDSFKNSSKPEHFSYACTS